MNNQDSKKRRGIRNETKMSFIFINFEESNLSLEFMVNESFAKWSWILRQRHTDEITI